MSDDVPHFTYLPVLISIRIHSSLELTEEDVNALDGRATAGGKFHLTVQPTVHQIAIVILIVFVFIRVYMFLLSLNLRA